jgi:EmrB/QacA subfamily drug resistance transporter
MSENSQPLHIRPIIAGLMLSMFLVALDGTIVSTAMPTIAGDLNGFALYAWVPSIYLLTSAVTTPIYGKVADLFGRKHVLFLGIGLFLLGSITSGAATSIGLLILFRGIQGLGAGAVQPVTMTIIGDIFTLEQRARMQGLFSSVWGISSVLGPLLGGAMVDNIGWRWIFYLNIPVGILAVIMIGTFFHEHAVPRRHTLDLAGATYLTVGLSAMLLLFIEGGSAWPWLSWQTAALSVVGLVALALFFREERRAAEPVLPLNLFNVRIIAVSTLAAIFSGAVMIGVTFEIPLYIQGVLGNDALHAGLALSPMSLGWPLAASISGRLAIRFGYRHTSLVGCALIVIGVGFLLELGLTDGFLLACLLSFVIGAGMGLSTTPMMIAVQSAVAWARRGIATSTIIFMRNFGGVVGLAVMGAIINNATGSIRSSSATNEALRLSHRVPAAVVERIHRVLLDGIHHAFLAALIASVITLAIAFFLPGGSAHEHEFREETLAESGTPDLAEAREAAS